MSNKNKVLDEFDNLREREVDQPGSLDDFVEVQNSDVDWKKHWVGMPEFENEAKKAHKSLTIHFRNEEDYQEFSQLVEQPLTRKSKSIWYPALSNYKNSLLRWIEDDE